MYHQRLANLKDITAIAPLWEKFLKERSHYDPSILLKSNFDYQSYVKRQLQQSSTYGFLLEYGDNKEIVGFLGVHVHDESNYLDDPLNSPFIPRRVGGATGMYVKKEHRKPQAIKLLIEAAMSLAEELKISDIDLLISIEQTGIHQLLERFGFQKSALQYTKHYDIMDQDLPPLKSVVSEGIKINLPKPNLIPLKDPKTQQTVLNSKGEMVFLHPLKNEQGEILRNSSGLPIYPAPLRNPQTQEWVFNELGELVTCPVALDEFGKVKEKNGIPVFKKPIYEMIQGQLRLKKDDQGNYLFEE